MRLTLNDQHNTTVYIESHNIPVAGSVKRKGKIKQLNSIEMIVI